MTMPTLRALGAGVGGLVLCAACNEPRQGRSVFEREIEPILVQNCSGNTSPCHQADPDSPFHFAAGNFDVTSYANVQKRRDLLVAYGPYQTPPLLIKAAASNGLEVPYRGPTELGQTPPPGNGFRDLEVLHAGGPIFDSGSEAYQTLQQWLADGAAENGVRPATPARKGTGECSTEIPTGFDANAARNHPAFAEFRDNVEPILKDKGCGAGSCHGAPQSDFYITCGDDEVQVAFNFQQARSFVDVAADVEESQLLRVPLAVGGGGGPHTGGDQLASRQSAEYETIKAWAEKDGVALPPFGAGDAGRTFFADHVQPILLVRGCTMQACHSPAATNDLKLRPGGQGFFSVISLEKNYRLLRDDFMALEYPDARRGRAVAKTVGPGFGGIAHRAGAVLDTSGSGGSDPAVCPPAYDPATASAFCTVQEWVDIERQALITGGEVLDLQTDPHVPVVYVDRAASHVAGPLEFDTYQPDSDLVVAVATLGAGQTITSVAGGRSLLDGCPGAGNRAVVDVRNPDVSRNGSTVAFAMRTSASEPLGIYTVELDGSGCKRITPAAADVGGLKIHDFDPAWSPDGGFIVFASTRGAAGPTRSRKLFLPQSDLWRMTADGGSPEQLTFLTNSEIEPQMMREGRISMTTEKVSAGFYQLSGRRINWDRTDYHPLLAQRASSPYADPADLTSTRPSVGYQQATEIRESSDGDFLLVLSDAGARGGAGTLAIFNRSIGPFEADRSDDGFLASMKIVDPAATGRVGAATSGAYRSPFGLPDGQILASYAAYNGDLATATSLDWDLVAVNPRTGARTVLVGGPRAQVEAVLALKYPRRTTYDNRRQLVFGGGISSDLGNTAIVHFPDAPMLFTLLTGNLRRGRPVEEFRRASQLAIYEEGAAPPGTTSGSGEGGIYEMRRLLGRADLAGDGSVKVQVPAGKGLILELQDGGGRAVVTMGEEHQVAPGEHINIGVRQELFNAVCGGCHGSVSGSELDVSMTPDALTGASQSASLTHGAIEVGN